MKRPQSRTFVPPSGDSKSNYIIVGEQPGKYEVRSRKCFIGPSGELLNSCLTAAGIGRSDCYITNVIKDLDRPIQRYIQLYKGTSLLKEPIISDEGQYYIDYLKWELSELPGRYIIAFGGIALFALTQRTGITKWRGSRLDCLLDQRKMVFPTYHPSTVIPPKNQYTNRFLIINDIKQAADSKASLYVPTNRTIMIEPTYSEVLNFINYVTEQGLKGERIAYDLEVFMDRKHKEVSCISISYKTQAMSIPFVLGYDDYFSLRQEAEIWLRLAYLLEHPKIKKCGQNLTFDGHFLLRKYGIKVRNFDDTMIAQQILMPDYPKGLDFITSIWTDHPYYKGDGKAFFKGSGAFRKFWRYNAVDSVICTEAFPKQLAEIRKQGNLETYHHQVRVVEPCVYMMEHGIKVRVDQMESEYRRMEEELFKTQGELDKEAGQHLNAKSPKQLKEYFWKQKGIKPYVYRGKPTYNDDAMKRLTRRGFKEAGLIQKIRKLTKLRSTYLDIRKIDDDGRYRCSYNPVGTRYSRVSSSANIFGSGGNFQNWPHELQRMLVPDDGYCYYAVDLGQAENRIVAYLGRVENMIEAFENGDDVHSLTASMIFHKPPSEITRTDGTCSLGDGTHSERFWGKKANHGFNYDWGYKNFALKNEIPEAEGKLIYNAYHRMYPGVQQIFHADIKRHLRTTRTLTNLMGRKTIFLGALNDNTFKEAYSCIPQGTVGDIINRRGINYIYYNQSIFKPVEILRQVHDEIGFQIPLTVPWIEHAKMLRLIKAELEIPLMTDYGREFIIPADISQGINLNKDDGVEYKGTLPITDLEFAQKLKQGWENLNDRKETI